MALSAAQEELHSQGAFLPTNEAQVKEIVTGVAKKIGDAYLEVFETKALDAMENFLMTAWKHGKVFAFTEGEDFKVSPAELEYMKTAFGTAPSEEDLQRLVKKSVNRRLRAGAQAPQSKHMIWC